VAWSASSTLVATGRTRTWSLSGALSAALGAALLANALDAATTWIGITRFQGREVGVLAWLVVRTWGLAPALIVLKGAGLLLILGIAVVGTKGADRWWRAKRSEQWVPIAALWAAAAWFGYLAGANALGMWDVYRLMRP
jgi:uncharacterized membrane protein